MGSCVGGAIFLLCRMSFIVDKTASIFLALQLIFKAIGEDIDNETLGGTTHCEISGVTDYKAKRR